MLLATLGASFLALAPNVLVVGGNGRVGGSTVRWLNKLDSSLSIAIGGRDENAFRAMRQRLQIPTLDWQPVDLDGGDAALTAAVAGYDLVVHTAGPFQQREDPALLRAAIAAGCPYCDVCDELLLARNAKELSAQAEEAGVACVVSCGIWPGVSALLAAEAVSKLGGKGACERLEFSFFTAGTGGAGPTIVSATFLLLATEVSCYVNGELVEREPWTDRQVRDFGVGEHECFLLDNPDVPTTAEALGINDCSSRFGTAPSFWNTLFGAMKALPKSLLMDKAKMQALSVFSMPIIRTVDALVGGTNAMRVDAFGKDGEKVTLRCVHEDLEDCVGQATAAFALECLQSSSSLSSSAAEGGGKTAATIKPGVWFPAELEKAARANILTKAKERTIVWEV